jgi:Protein of unknown function (DUF1580)
MIDILKETLIPLQKVADQLPIRDGKKIHHSTVFRWATSGVRGRKLEAIRVGGRFFTSCEKLREFLAVGDDSTTRPPKASLTASQAIAELERRGI